MLNEQQIYLFGQIQTSQTGGQPYSDRPFTKKVISSDNCDTITATVKI